MGPSAANVGWPTCRSREEPSNLDRVDIAGRRDNMMKEPKLVRQQKDETEMGTKKNPSSKANRRGREGGRERSWMWSPQAPSQHPHPHLAISRALPPVHSSTRASCKICPAAGSTPVTVVVAVIVVESASAEVGRLEGVGRGREGSEARKWRRGGTSAIAAGKGNKRPGARRHGRGPGEQRSDGVGKTTSYSR
uniref:Uncharacterized protein n=1 Tax=Oryza glumipatula TaxID=40148 RepID=A0A0E0AXP0_9ORYZ